MPMSSNRIIRVVTAIGALLCGMVVNAQQFINHGPANKFITLDLHGIVGGVEVLQNYGSTFPEISELDVSMSTTFGAGVGAEMAFSDFIGLGLQGNFLINNYRMNMAVANDEGPSMTNCFIRNHFYTFNFPVYIATHYNLGQRVRWNVDLGMYYMYGVGGTSKAALYNARVNELGQLVTSLTHQKSGYLNSRETLLSSSYRSDIGLHVATGFTFSQRVKVALAAQVGFKNVSHVYDGVKRPNIHNFNFHCLVGWCF